MLCVTCTETLKELKYIENWIELPHHHCISCYKESYEQGCYVCNSLYIYLPDQERKALTDDNVTWSRCDKATKELSRRANTGERPFIKSQLCKGGLDDETPLGSYCWKLLFPAYSNGPLEPRQYPKIFLKPVSASHSTSSEETFMFAARWLKECVQHHSCGSRALAKKSWYPSRLLFCGSEHDPHLHLVDTGKLKIRGPYMTLSHCWGAAETLRLTTENHDALSAVISLDSLPLLYRDTVQIVRQLGIRYLWIDSLCIVQEGDHSADWHRQVTQMTDIYANSYCNISALMALDSHQSLFSQSGVPNWASQLVTVDETTYLVTASNYWISEITFPEYGLNTRAWVLQERLTSPRVLHFGASQLLWECRQLDASETHPEGVPTRMTTHGNGVRFKEFLPIDAEFDSISQEDHYSCWVDLVNRYTACRLTFPSDRLPAISAAAKLFNIALDDEYVAGMWRGNLEKEMLWFRQGPNPRPGSRPSDKTYRCPTWSWASMDSSIEWAANSTESHIKVTDVRLSHITTDITGPIRHGWLQLRGLLRRVSVTTSESVDDSELQMIIGNVKFGCSWPGTRVILDRSSMADHIVNVGKGGNLFCMHAGTTPDFYESKTLTQVLLFQLLDVKQGVYGRVGYCRGLGDPLFVKQLQKVQPEQSMFPCEKYEEPFHHIRII